MRWAPLRGRDADDADLVGAPVADRPQRIRVAPQELGAHGVNRAPLSAVSDGADGAEARGDTAPSHQPTHRRLHRLWTNGARDERERRCGTCCHDNAAGEGVRAAHAGRACAPGKGPTRPSPGRQQRKCGFRELRRSGRPVSAPPRPVPVEGEEWRRPETAAISGHSRTVGQTLTGPSLFGHSLEAPPRAHTVPRPLATPPRTVREVGLTSRTGPPPAGNGAAVSPSPLSPVQRADPRGTQPSVTATAGPERTGGRTATHREHAAPRPAHPRPDGPDRPHGQQSRHPDVCPLTVGIGRTTLCLLVFSTGGHIPRGSATCVCRRSTRVRTWGGIGTNAARRPR